MFFILIIWICLSSNGQYFLRCIKKHESSQSSCFWFYKSLYELATFMYLSNLKFLLNITKNDLSDLTITKKSRPFFKCFLLVFLYECHSHYLYNLLQSKPSRLYFSHLIRFTVFSWCAPYDLWKIFHMCIR